MGAYWYRSMPAAWLRPCPDVPVGIGAVFGGADTAAACRAMPPSRMSATAVRRGTFPQQPGGGQESQPGTDDERQRADARRVEAGTPSAAPGGDDRKGQADAGHPEFSVHGAKSAIYPGGIIIRGPAE